MDISWNIDIRRRDISWNIDIRRTVTQTSAGHRHQQKHHTNINCNIKYKINGNITWTTAETLQTTARTSDRQELEHHIDIRKIIAQTSEGTSRRQQQKQLTANSRNSLLTDDKMPAERKSFHNATCHFLPGMIFQAKSKRLITRCLHSISQILTKTIT